jgi:hypothetical protein
MLFFSHIFRLASPLERVPLVPKGVKKSVAEVVVLMIRILPFITTTGKCGPLEVGREDDSTLLTNPRKSFTNSPIKSSPRERSEGRAPRVWGPRVELRNSSNEGYILFYRMVV